MHFYWYDHDCDTSATTPVLAGLGRLVEKFDAERINLPSDFSSKPYGKLGFIHAGDEDGITTDDWKKVARDNAWIVFVSSESIGQCNRPQYVHNLKLPCRNVADHLTQDIAKTFIRTCNDSNPDFTLFYPRQIDNLIALYLLELTRAEINKDVNATIYQEIQEAAQSEYSTLRPGKKLSDISNLLTALRELLTQQVGVR